ncbi:Uncharacterised protein [Mycobacteroides abscessus subsp. abscessus]|nr:Uncharacterised protein [Mycobacteroides abscessus subsp. abscessus]
MNLDPIRSATAMAESTTASAVNRGGLPCRAGNGTTLRQSSSMVLTSASPVP